MDRILVGTDGSVGGRTAVRWAIEAARATGAELIVAATWKPRLAKVSHQEYEQFRRDAQGVLDDDRTQAAHGANPPCRTLLLEGDARDELLGAAEHEDVDLLVVGSCGTGSHLHAGHLGSVTHHLVHYTTRPLVAVPASALSSWPKRVVVGVDGSSASARAVAWCRDAAAGLLTEVIVVHAAAPSAEPVPRSDPESWCEAALKHCNIWATPLRDAGIPTRTVVVEHEPVTALTETALDEQAGLIVVGTRGLGGVTGLRLGSTALKVLHHSAVPVALIPHEAV